MGGVKHSKKSAKLGNRRTPKLTKSIINGLVGHNRERHAILATAEEENQRVLCVDDITGKELPWSEVRQT